MPQEERNQDEMTSSFYSSFGSPGYIEPTICFTRERLTIDEHYPLERLPVTRLVQPGQVLLEFPPPAPAGDNRLRRTVSCGANTSLSEDGTKVVAMVAGYPEIRFCPMEASEEQALEVSVAPLFSLSRDRMRASIVLHPLLLDYPTISKEELYQLLTVSGIVTGVDYRQLSLVKQCVENGRADDERIVVARGTDPIPGRDAHLKFQLEIGPIAGELLDDGSIDFRERKIMVPVSAGQMIDVKAPPTSGRPGATVLGERKAQRHGRDIEVHTAGDAVYSEASRQVTATCDGVLSIVKNSVIKVFSKIEIPGNIDYATGNVESSNCVVVRGSVLPNFKVRTGGDLEIRGSVTSAQVLSMANIVVKGGILGRSSIVSASGDVDINFIEQGKIRCGGTCVIRKQCYYSAIWCGDHIRCRKESILVGGELIAEGSISAGSVGGPDADPAFLAAGVSAERVVQSRNLLMRLEEYKTSIIQRLKGYTGDARSKKLQKLKGGADKLEHLLKKINMIPGTGLYSRPPEGDGGDGVVKVDSKPHEGPATFDIGAITIDIHGTAHPGTILQIGNRTRTLDQHLSATRFYLDEAQGRIISRPLR